MPFTPDFRTLGLLAVVVAFATVAVGALAWPRANDGDPRLKRLGRVAIALSGATYVLLVLGSSVRVNGAGLACPDWPACFGRVVPALDWEVSLEFGHRVYAGGISLLFLAVGVAVWRTAALRHVRPWVGLAAVALITQVILGGLTVLHLLAEWTVASHLLVGNTFSLLLAVIAMEIANAASPAARRPVSVVQRGVGVALMALVLAQLALGGLVASSHSGLACGTWPGCNGPVMFPTFEGAVGLQVMHRITAYGIVAVALVAAAVNGRRGGAGRAGIAVAVIALLQAGLGISNVLLRLPVEVTLLHSAGAAALVLATAWLNHEVWRAPLHAAVVPHLGQARAVEAK